MGDVGKQKIGIWMIWVCVEYEVLVIYSDGSRTLTHPVSSAPSPGPDTDIEMKGMEITWIQVTNQITKSEHTPFCCFNQNKIYYQTLTTKN